MLRNWKKTLSDKQVPIVLIVMGLLFSLIVGFRTSSQSSCSSCFPGPAACLSGSGGSTGVHSHK